MAQTRKPTWRDLRPGMAFEVPVEGDISALGVILDRDVELYIGIYGGRYLRGMDPVRFMADNDLMLIGRTMDECFHRREWTLLGLVELPDVPRPCYVVNTPDGLCVKNFHGRVVRKATEDDLDFYGFRVNVPNVAFVSALKRINGIGCEDFDYSRIDAIKVRERSAIIN